MGRNNFRSLEGLGFFLEMSSNYTRIPGNRHIYNSWFQGFIDNIHLLDLRPKKWLKSSRFPVINLQFGDLEKFPRLERELLLLNITLGIPGPVHLLSGASEISV